MVVVGDYFVLHNRLITSVNELFLTIKTTLKHILSDFKKSASVPIPIRIRTISDILKIRIRIRIRVISDPLRI
jgi:hypothetical protein